MQLLFCDDIRFIFDESGNAYVEGQFHYDVWRRYLEVFDTVTVLGRQRPLPAGRTFEALNLSSGSGVSFVTVPGLSGPVRLMRCYNAVARRIREAMATCDAVIVRLPSQNGLIAAGAARKLGKPWAAEVAACPWDQLWNFGTWQAKAFAPIQWLRMRRAIRSSPRTLYVSRSFLQRRYPARGVTAAISDVDLPATEQAVIEARLQRIENATGPFVLGMIGSIEHQYKGIGVAMDALARVRDRLPEIELRVLGPGDPQPWREAARQRGVEDKIRFCGVLQSGQPVLDWLDQIDLYLQPSFQEGLPRALLEAMSRGCPALGSTAGGIPELLPAACLHRPGDAARLASSILDVARDAGWQREQAQRNFREAGDYARERLDARRRDFWRQLAAEAEGLRLRGSGQTARGEPGQRHEPGTALQK